MGPLQVLVGPNASGKTTFLDVVAFLGDLVSDGLAAALDKRTQNFSDLVWGRTEGSFELAIEARIPGPYRGYAAKPEHDTIRYEVCIGPGEDANEVVILAEKVLLIPSRNDAMVCEEQRELFPEEKVIPKTIMTSSHSQANQVVVNKKAGGNDNFYPELSAEKKKRWAISLKLGVRKSALGNLPEDESKFPVSLWLKALLVGGVQQLVLNSMVIRKASPPGQGAGFNPDGSNLPWVIQELERSAPDRIEDWVSHLKTALPDLEKIRTVERPDDKHRYIVLHYADGLEVPSWMASDGTLRLLALTLPAYLPQLQGTYLIEEPENGIHPRAVETMFQSLSSVYDAQILMATHSPVILSLVKPADVLCFAKTPDGQTDIVSGDTHPALRGWRGETTLGTLFAGGVLG